MPSSFVRAFADPDEYGAAIPANVEMTIVGRGRFHGNLTRVDLHRLHLQRCSDNLPRARYALNNPGWAAFMFRTDAGPSFLRDGREVLSTTIVRAPEGAANYQRSSGAVAVGAMWLPVEEMASLGAAIAGSDLAPPRNAMLISPPAPAMARLQRLHAAAGRLAEHAPEILANRDAARGLEQVLIEALVQALARQRDHDDRVARGQHAIVMRRFHRVLEEKADQPLYIPEVCTAIRVSERTLRICCQEYLGMSPKRYLLLRRMHMARRALRDRAGNATTVTEIATQHGFWQLGRFAVEYRALFGESPSTTLQKRPAREFDA